MISEMTFKQRSLLFAKLASIAYEDEKAAKKQVKELGFTEVEFYNRDGAQAYRFQNKTDMVIACRGTQPTEFNDIKADLRALPVLSETVSRVHKGFKGEVDELWPMILEDIDPKAVGDRKVWVCGHSLGAAMATIVAARCTLEESIPNIQVEELYTYGSPRVGWNKYCKSLPVMHHRWRNNNDIVTTVPPAFLGYKHHGHSHYINAYGQVRDLSGWQLVKDKLRGIWMGLKQGKIDSFGDHSMVEYIKHLENWNKEEV